MRYIIETAGNPEELTKQVNERIKQGYRVNKGPFTSNLPYPDFTQFHQSMLLDSGHSKPTNQIKGPEVTKAFSSLGNIIKEVDQANQDIKQTDFPEFYSTEYPPGLNLSQDKDKTVRWQANLTESGVAYTPLINPS